MKFMPIFLLEDPVTIHPLELVAGIRVCTSQIPLNCVTVEDYLINILQDIAAATPAQILKVVPYVIEEIKPAIENLIVGVAVYDAYIGVYVELSDSPKVEEALHNAFMHTMWRHHLFGALYPKEDWMSMMGWSQEEEE